MKALLGALIKAQGEFEAVVKDAKNPHLNSKYATLGSVNEAVDGALRKHGLIVLQDARTEFDEAGRCLVVVGTSLWHAESGESVSHSLALIAPQTTPQGIGSAISYGRRYGKMTLLGLAAEDDDANGASGTKVPQGKAEGKGNGNAAPPPPAAKPKGKTQPEAQTEPPAPATPSTNGNGNALPFAPNVDAAKAWAVEVGACQNEFEARNSLKKIVDGQFSGRLTTGNTAAVFAAFHARQLEKLGQRNMAPTEPPAEVDFGMGDNATAPNFHS